MQRGKKPEKLKKKLFLNLPGRFFKLWYVYGPVLFHSKLPLLYIAYQLPHIFASFLSWQCQLLSTQCMD